MKPEKIKSVDDWHALGEAVANGKEVSTDGFTDAEYYTWQPHRLRLIQGGKG